MRSNIYNINEIICGYAVSITFFSILLSTALVNVGILLAVFTGLIILFKDKQYIEVFIKNKINLSIVFLILILVASSFYTIASFDEGILCLKKYIKLLYIPVIYYILQIEWIKNKATNYFIAGCTIIMFLSYMKYVNIISPSSLSKFSNFLGLNYEDKLYIGVAIFQHSIIHGTVLCFYFIITFLKARKTNNYIYYMLCFLSFYNIFFMNISRTSYLILMILSLLIIFKYFREKSYRKNFIIFIVLILSVIIGNKSTIIDRYNESLANIVSIKKNRYSTSFGLRYIYADNGIKNLERKPVFGFGLGSYKSTIKNYFSENNLKLEDYISQNPHSELISISTQTGLAGILVFFTFIYFLIENFFSTTIGKSVIVIIIVNCLVNSIFYDNVMGIFAVLIISFAMQSHKTIKA